MTSSDYNAIETVIPRGSGAVKATLVRLQPFASDRAASDLFSDLVEGRTIHVSAGSLLHDPFCRESHRYGWPAHFLKCMTISFEILVLEFPSPQHPRAYCLSPAISSKRFPLHPHLRGNDIFIARDMYTALCAYSISDGTYAPESGLTRFLDYLAIYLAKHLYWLRSQVLWDARSGTILDGPLGINELWRLALSTPDSPVRRQGLWVGEQVHATPHLWFQNTLPEAPCYCGSGSSYDRCHRQHNRSYADAYFSDMTNIFNQELNAFRCSRLTFRDQNLLPSVASH